jgi:cytochrome c-type biogenesis protein CcmH/NrfG
VARRRPGSPAARGARGPGPGPGRAAARGSRRLALPRPARLQTGEAFAAVRALERAAELGGTADDYTALGEALAAFNEGQVGEGAAAAFAEAVRRDPTSVPARYGVALGRLAAGDVAGGRAALAALAASLPAGDARRQALEAELARPADPPAASAPLP